jgi:hypothetical protein
MSSNTAEVLFFMAYHSFLLQKPDFPDTFEMLLDHYENHPESFSQFSKQEVLRIKQMQNAYKTGRIILFEGTDISQYSDPPQGAHKSDKNHKELCIGIYLHRAQTLEPYTGPVESACLEYPVLYGDIDIMIQSGLCAYVIEVKTEPAEHDIIGQVMKYFIGLSLKLILRHFNEVKMITLCPGYNPMAYKGLQQIGALPLIIDPKTFKVSPCR